MTPLLPELEQSLGAHPFVKHAATVVLGSGTDRQRIGAVVVPGEMGVERLRADGRVAFVKTLRRHLAQHIDVAVLPRHWRIRIALPVDAHGQPSAVALAELFEPSDRLAELLAESQTAVDSQFELRVPRDLVYFSGHFPGFPILPGVVQVDWMMRIAARHFPFACEVVSLEQLKFVSPVLPGATLVLTVTHDAERQRLLFAYTSDGHPCASGRILYRERACA